MSMPSGAAGKRKDPREAGDQAVGTLRRQLAEPGRVTAYRGQRAVRVDPIALSDLIDAYVAMRHEH